MTRLQIGFRGERNYLHSVDLLDGVVGYFLSGSRNAIFSGELAIKFLRPMNTVPNLEITNPERRFDNDLKTAATFRIRCEGKVIHGRLKASEEIVKLRTAVNERSVKNLLEESHFAASFREDANVSIQEAIVIGARSMLETQISHAENFRWAVAHLNFEGLPVSLAAPHASLTCLRLAISPGARAADREFHSLEIFWRDRPTGEIILRRVPR